MVGWRLLMACVENPTWRMRRKAWEKTECIWYVGKDEKKRKAGRPWRIHYAEDNVDAEFYPADYAEFDHSDWELVD